MAWSSRVLLIEPDTSIQQFLVRLLGRQRPDLELVIVAHVPAALLALETAPVAAIITSANALLGTLKDVVNAARAQPVHIPVVVLSGNPLAELEAKAVGADIFLPKPFDIGTFVARINCLIPQQS